MLSSQPRGHAPLVTSLAYGALMAPIASGLCAFSDSSVDEAGLGASVLSGLLVVANLAWKARHSSVRPATREAVRAVVASLRPCVEAFLREHRGIGSERTLVPSSRALAYVPPTAIPSRGRRAA